MHRNLRVALSLISLAFAGCTSNPKAKIDEAADLAEQRRGQRPAWTEAPEAVPPDWSTAVVLPMDETVALALRNNRTLRADLEMIGQADAELLQASLMQNPMISFMVMFPDGGGRSMLRGTGIPIQPLQDLWLIPFRKKAATAMLQQAVLRVADRAIETAATVKAAYVKLQYTQRAIALLQENMRLAEQSAQLVQSRQVAGQATQVAYNLAHIRYQRLRSELLTMESEYRTLQRELLALVGFAGAPDRWTVQPVHEMQDELRPPRGEDALVALGAAQRLDLKAAEWSTQAAEQRIALMRAEGLPDLALGFSFERAPATRAARGPTIPARVGNATAQALANQVYGVKPMAQAPALAPWQPKIREVKWTLGPMIDLEIPLFDQNQAQVAKAMHEYNQKLAEYEGRVQDATRDIRAAQVRQQQAVEQVRFYRTEIMPEVQRNLELAQQAFITGQEGLTVYLQAQDDLIMTRRTILEFLRDYYLSGVELERAVGGRIGTDPAALSPGEGEVPAKPPQTPGTTAASPPADEVSHEHTE